MQADARPQGTVGGVLVRWEALLPAAPGRPAEPHPASDPPPTLAPADRAAEIIRFRVALAASIADLDRIESHQTTVGARQWVDDRRRALQLDAWVSRIAYLIDRDGLPAGAAVATAYTWLRSLAVPVVDGAALSQVANWLQLRLNGLAAPLAPRSILGLQRVGPEDLLLLDLLAPPAVVAETVDPGELRLWLPVVAAPLPPDGEQVAVDLETGALKIGSVPGALSVVEPHQILTRWEEVALLAYVPGAAPGPDPLGVDLDRLLRKPLHPGALHLLAAAVKRAPLAVGGQAAYDPALLPIWWGMGVRRWFLPPEAAPTWVDPRKARDAWKAVAACRTASALRKALHMLQREY